MHFFWIYLCVFLTQVCIVFTIDDHVEVVRSGSDLDHRCVDPLMDTEEKLPDSAFKSSSYFGNSDQFKPRHARIVDVYTGTEHTSGNAWCPNATVKTDMNEWIEVNFPTLVISGIIFTAGRGDGNFREHMPSFVVQYQREDDGEWYEHRTRGAERVIAANNDPRSVIRNTLDPAIISKRLRIYPYSEKMHQQICLRFALFGCEFQDGIIEYRAPDGNLRSLPSGATPYVNRRYKFDFRDTINDRRLAMTTSHIAGGLGKLVDNLAFLGNVTEDKAMDSESLGHHFVGWQSVYGGAGPARVEIQLKFDIMRNFSQLLLFSFDSPQLQSSLFKQVVVHFSNDGISYPEENTITFPMNAAVLQDLDSLKSWKDSDVRAVDVRGASKIVRSRAWDGAVIVNLPLKGHLGRFVRLDLEHADEWILLSEVEFFSVPYVPPINIPPENEGITEMEEKPDGEHFNLVPTSSVETRDQYPGFDANENLFANPRTQSQLKLPMDAVDQLPAQGFPQAPQQRELDWEAKQNSSSRGTTFIIIVVVALFVTSLFVGLVFVICLRFQRIRRQQSLKKITLSECHQPLGGVSNPTTTTANGAMEYPTSYSSRVPCQQIQMPVSQAYLVDGGSNLSSAMYNPPFPVFNQNQTPLSVFGASIEHGGLRESNLGPAGTAFHGLSSPAHGFVGGDLSALSGYNPSGMRLAMQLGNTGQPTLFLGNGQAIPLGGTGMIHPGGDTTTDSGSLYTLPPDFGALEMSPRNAVTLVPTGAELQQQRSHQNDGSSDGMSACEPTSGREASPKAPNSTSLVTTSSEGAQLLSSKVANEKSRRTSASTGASHSFEDDEEEDDDDEEDTRSCQSGEASALLSSQRSAAPLRRQANGEQQPQPPSRQRKRSKRRQRPATSGNVAVRGQTPSQPLRRATQTIMQDSIQHSGADSGLGSSRADVPPNIRGGRPLQHFTQQPFPSDGELLGTEYASASLFGSSNASMTNKIGSPPLMNNHQFVGGANSTTCGTVISHFSADNKMSQASGGSTYQLRMTPSGDNIAPGFGPYHLYQPVGTILIPSAHSSNQTFQANFPLQAPLSYLGEQNIGMLSGAQGIAPHFLSQNLLRSEPLTNFPSETGVLNNNAWPRSTTSDSSQITPPISTMNPPPTNWSSTTLKMNPSTYPLPPIPSLPQSPNPPTGDGTSSGRLSIYSVCI